MNYFWNTVSAADIRCHIKAWEHTRIMSAPSIDVQNDWSLKWSSKGISLFILKMRGYAFPVRTRAIRWLLQHTLIQIRHNSHPQIGTMKRQKPGNYPRKWSCRLIDPKTTIFFPYGSCVSEQELSLGFDRGPPDSQPHREPQRRTLGRVPSRTLGMTSAPRVGVSSCIDVVSSSTFGIMRDTPRSFSHTGTFFDLKVKHR